MAPPAPRQPRPAPSAPVAAPQGAPADLDRLVQEAFDKIGTAGTQSRDSFEQSLPKASEADSDPDEQVEMMGQGARAMFAPRGETAEERLRREYEAAQDPELDIEDGEATGDAQEALEVEELDEDGVAVELLSRASSSFILDGPGTLQFNNFCLDDDGDDDILGDDDEPGYVPSSLSTSPRHKQKHSGTTSSGSDPLTAASSDNSSGVQLEPQPPVSSRRQQQQQQQQKGAPVVRDCDVLDGPAIHKSLHGRPPVAGPEEASEQADAQRPEEMLDGIVMSASIPENIPGTLDDGDADGNCPVGLPGGGIFTDADAFIQQSLPDMTSRDSSGAVEILEVANEEEGREALVEAADDAGASAGGAADEACTEGTEDAVETFKLDEDFDYDNCKLTPKPWPWDPRAPRPSGE